MAPWKQMWKKLTSAEPKSKESPLGSTLIRDRDPEASWTTLEKLGDGAFAVVYKAQHKTIKNKMAALKLVEDIKSVEETEMMLVLLEIEILTKCQHEYVLGLEEAYLCQDKLYMYLELCDGGGLDSIMQELQKGLTEAQIRVVASQTCKALHYLHRSMIMHRDIKAANILLTSNGTTRLADFGVSAMNNSYEQKRNTFIGTPYWTAPEVFECADFPQNAYDYKADIWSLGITLIELAEIEPPHHTVRPERLFPKVVKGPPPKLSTASGVKWHSDFHDMVEKCLQKDASLRPSSNELLDHPFVSSVTDNKPLVELYAEFRADVVDEEVSEDDDAAASPNSLSNINNSSSENILVKTPSIDNSGADNNNEITNKVEPQEQFASNSKHESSTETSEQTTAAVFDTVGSREKEEENRNDMISNGDHKAVEKLGVENEQTKEEETVDQIVSSGTGDHVTEDSTTNNKLDDHVLSIGTTDVSEKLPPSSDSESVEHMNSEIGVDNGSPSTEDDSKDPSETPNYIQTQSSENLSETEFKNENRASRAEELKKELNLASLTTTTRITKLKSGDDEEDDRENKTNAEGQRSVKDSSNMSEQEKLERKKQYKSIRRTRRFIIDGKVVTSTQNKVVTMDGKKDLAFEKLQRRKEAMREVSKFQRREKILFEKAGQDIDMKQKEFEARVKNEENCEYKRFQNEYDKLEKNYNNALLKLDQRNDREFNIERNRMKQENEHDLKRFKRRLKDSAKNKIKIEESRLARDGENSDKRIESFRANLEEENAEKEKQHSQMLEDRFNARLREIRVTHIEEWYNLEMDFLNEKQSLMRQKREKINDLKEKNMKENHEMLKEANRERFGLVRRLNLEKYDKQLLDMNSAHEKEMDELKSIHLNDIKQLPKDIKKENRSRMQMHDAQIEIMLEKKQITESEAKLKKSEFKKNEENRKVALMKKRERKQQDEISTMQDRHSNELAELYLFQNEEKTRLDKTEKDKQAIAESEHERVKEKFKEQIRFEEKQSEEEFLQDVEELKRKYASKNENIDEQVQWMLKFTSNKNGSTKSTMSSSVREPGSSSRALDSKFSPGASLKSFMSQGSMSSSNSSHRLSIGTPFMFSQSSMSPSDTASPPLSGETNSNLFDSIKEETNPSSQDRPAPVLAESKDEVL